MYDIEKINHPPTKEDYNRLVEFVRQLVIRDANGLIVDVGSGGTTLSVAAAEQVDVVTDVTYNTWTGVLAKKSRPALVLWLGEETTTTIETAQACP